MSLVLMIICGSSFAWWGAQGLLYLWGRRRVLRVSELSGVVDARSLPTLSLVMPARNEAAALEAALTIKLSSTYPNLELILVDDRSTDRTGEIAERFAAKDPRLKVAHVTEVPPGWLGKLNALACGLAASTGEFVLFSDADIEITQGALERVVSECERRRLDFVSIFPGMRLRGLWLTSTLATMFRVLITFTRPWSVRDEGSSAFMGVGAFNLVRRGALAKTPGLEFLRMETGDDVALGAMMKASGARCEAFIGRDEVCLEFYPSYRALVQAVEKNGGSAPFLVLMAGVATFLIGELGFLAGFGLGGGWAWASAGLVLSAPLLARGVARWLGYPAWTSFIPWLGVLLLAWAMARSAILALVRGGIVWRGTFYPQREVAAGRRMFKRGGFKTPPQP